MDRFIQRESSSDDAIRHQLDKYGDVHIWSLVEIMEFNTIITVFKHMKGKDQKLVAHHFDSANSRILISHFEAINNLRNKVAHHARILNRNFSRSPEIDAAQKHTFFEGIDRGNLSKQKYRIYPLICILANLMSVIDDSGTWKRELLSILDEFPETVSISLDSAGFPQDWRTFKCWAQGDSQMTA